MKVEVNYKGIGEYHDRIAGAMHIWGELGRQGRKVMIEIGDLGHYRAMPDLFQVPSVTEVLALLKTVDADSVKKIVKKDEPIPPGMKRGRFGRMVPIDQPTTTEVTA